MVANDAGSGDDRVPLVLVVFLLLQLNQVSGAGISTVHIGAGALISGGSRIVFGGMSIATRISLVTLLHSLTLVRISRLRLGFFYKSCKRLDHLHNVPVFLVQLPVLIELETSCFGCGRVKNFCGSHPGCWLSSTALREFWKYLRKDGVRNVGGWGGFDSGRHIDCVV